MQRTVYNLSRAMAVVGGVVLLALVLMVCTSVLGRATSGLLYSDFFQTSLSGLSTWLIELSLPGLWGPIEIGPITGDYELVEAGLAFTIFAFIPFTQITVGHAKVDIFTNWLPERGQRVLLCLTDILFAVVLVIIAMQLKEGMDSKLRSGQTTFLLQFPVWWAYAASLVGAVLSALVAIYVAAVRVIELTTNQTLLSDEEGAEH